MRAICSGVMPALKCGAASRSISGIHRAGADGDHADALCGRPSTARISLSPATPNFETTYALRPGNFSDLWHARERGEIDNHSAAAHLHRLERGAAAEGSVSVQIGIEHEYLTVAVSIGEGHRRHRARRVDENRYRPQRRPRPREELGDAILVGDIRRTASALPPAAVISATLAASAPAATRRQHDRRALRRERQRRRAPDATACSSNDGDLPQPATAIAQVSRALAVVRSCRRL